MLRYALNDTGGTWISRRIVRSLLANRLELLVFGTNWTTWHLVVREQACKISHKMDSSLWQTTSKVDFQSPHKWLPTTWSWWNHSSALSIGFIQRLRFCWRPWGLKFNLSVVFYVHCSEVEHLSQSVGCVRNILQFHTVSQSLRSFLKMLAGLRMDAWSLGLGDWSFTDQWQQGSTKPYEPPGNWCSSVHTSKHQETGSSSEIQHQGTTCHKKSEGWSIKSSGSRAHKHTFSSGRVPAVHFLKIMKMWSKR